MARECRNAWANLSTSVRRPAAPAAPAPAAAPAAADPSAAPDAPASAAAPVAGSSGTPPAKSETAMAVSDDEESDMDYIPGEDEEAHLSDSPEFASGDEEVVAAAPTTPSPRRPRRKRKRRGQGPPAPAPVLDPESGVMDLSSKEPSDARLLHTFREVWEDTLSWEEIRARKVDMSGFDPSQVPCNTLKLFYETQPDLSSSSPTPVPLDSPVPSTFSSDGSIVATMPRRLKFRTTSPGARSRYTSR